MAHNASRKFKYHCILDIKKKKSSFYKPYMHGLHCCFSITQDDEALRC
jgi:hypothetical protein